MELTSDLSQMLSMLPGPAFAAREGIIICCNAAAQVLVQPGTAVATLSEPETLTTPQQGDSLYLGLNIGGIRWGAAVTCLSDCQLYCLEPTGLTPELKAMSLLCSQLRIPLASLSLLTCGKHSAEANRELSRILRILNNVSNAERFALDDGSCRQTRDLCAVVGELLEECAALLKEGDILLRIRLPQKAVYTALDENMLRHAVYAMVDNAAKHTAPGAMIEAVLTANEKFARLSITDHGSGIPDEIRGSLFSRYTRQPGIEDGLQNLGLGMTLIRTAAVSHGGTVLVETLNTKGTRVTMTMALAMQPPKDLQTIRTPLVTSKDDARTMLSNVLPAKLYE